MFVNISGMCDQGRYYEPVNYEVETSVYAFLKSRCHLKEKKTAVVDNFTGVRWTYQELLTQVEQVCEFFKVHGVRKGDNVALHLDNSMEAYVSALAIACIPATTVIIRPSFKYREVSPILNVSESSSVVTDVKHIETIRRTRDDQDLRQRIKKIFLIGSSENDEFPSLTKFIFNTSRQHPYEFTFDDSDCSDLTVMMAPTSGTSGHPKLVEHTHRSMLNSFYMSCHPHVNVFNSSDIILGWSNITHVTGIWNLGCTLQVGATLVVVKHNTVMNFCELRDICEQYQVTSFMVFPMLFKELLGKATGEPIRTLQSITIGGTVAPPGLGHCVQRWFPNIQQMRNLYGQSEALVPVCVTPAFEFDIDTVGYPVTNMKLRIVHRDSGEILGPGEVGEVYYMGPNLMRGYYKNRLATTYIMTDDGWCKTGDVGYLDSRGRLVYMDRIMEMIRCKDNFLPPAELENVILEHSSVRQVAVIGVAHEAYGEAPTALVVVNKGVKETDALKTEIITLVKNQLASFKRLYGGVFFVPSLPMTDSGKVMRRKLKDMLKEELG